MRKLFAGFVSVAMLLEILPVAALAQGESSASAGVSSQSSVGSSPESTLTIVGEDISRREANVKHFHMNNDSYVAAVYSEDVHYQDYNGNWQDIDNTLERKTKENRDAYYTNKSNTIDVEMPAYTYQQITAGDHTLSWTLENQHSVSALVTNPEDLKDEEASSPMALSADNDNTKLPDEAMAPENQTSRVEYANLLPDTDVRYDVTGTKLKESLIFDKKSGGLQCE